MASQCFTLVTVALLLGVIKTEPPDLMALTDNQTPSVGTKHWAATPSTANLTFDLDHFHSPTCLLTETKIHQRTRSALVSTFNRSLTQNTSDIYILTNELKPSMVDRAAKVPIKMETIDMDPDLYDFLRFLNTTLIRPTTTDKSHQKTGESLVTNNERRQQTLEKDENTMTESFSVPEEKPLQAFSCLAAGTGLLFVLTARAVCQVGWATAGSHQTEGGGGTLIMAVA